MSYFEGQTPSWAHRRQQSWDPQQAHPARTGASPISPREDMPAFGTQFEEIARASDNLAKSGKMQQPTHHNRAESMPVAGAFARQYPEIDSRLGNMGQRAHPMGDFDAPRGQGPHSSGLQGYLANQRFGPRANDGDQALQAKRRAAAQRERELRNYHQEQQYNRNGQASARASGPKSDRSMSPGGMSEEDRRELIARQHRALYGNESSLYSGDGSSSRPISQDARVLAAQSSGHGSSPLAFDPYAMGQSSTAEGAGPMLPTAGSQQQSRGDTASPHGDSTAFGNFESSQQQQVNRTSSSSPGTSPTRRGTKAPTSGSVAPIGTRPAQGPGQGKRHTPPMPSTLSYGLGSEKGGNNSAERSTSAASNPNNNTGSGGDKGVNLGWNSSGWGNSKNSLGVQAPVWG